MWHGAALYRSEDFTQDRRIIDHARPGLEGAYVFSRDAGGHTIVGADYFGFYPLFLYQSGDGWALGDSLWSLVNYAAACGRLLSIDETALYALFSDKQFFQQQAGPETPITQIRLLHRSEYATIDNDHVRICQRPDAKTESYDSALQEFAETWLRRISNLSSDTSLSLSCDLSGGLDSRTVFSVFSRSIRTGQIDFDRFSIFSKASDPRSASIARELRDAVNPAIPMKQRPIGRPRPRSEVLSSWEEACLGVYTPIRSAVTLPDFNTLHFSGGHGETYRAFYALQPDFRESILDFGRRYSNFGKGRKKEWIAKFRNALSELKSANPNLAAFEDQLVYATVRSRFHTGISCRQAHTIAPLASPTLEAALAMSPYGGSPDGQVLYDVIGLCDPSLLDIRFDADRKKLSPDQRARLPKPLPSNFVAQGPLSHRAIVNLATDSPANDVKDEPAEDVSNALARTIPSDLRSVPRRYKTYALELRCWDIGRKIRNGKAVGASKQKVLHCGHLLCRLNRLGILAER